METQSKQSTILSQTNNVQLPLIPGPEHPSPDHNHAIEINDRSDQNRWKPIEERLFYTFWFIKFLNCPYDIFSFHQPLSRRAYFIELSTFLKVQGLKENTEINKDKDKCKSKFETIKRQTRRTIKAGKQPKDYDFIDYIIVQGEKIVSKEPNEYISGLISQLKNMKEEKSELMKVTEQLRRLEISEYENLGNNILKYSQNLNSKAKSRQNQDSK